MSSSDDRARVPYLQRHPRQAQAIGCVVLLGCVFLAVYVLGVVLDWLKQLFDWLSTLDVVIVVALITGVVTVICSVFKAVADAHQSRIAYLSEKREGSYALFVDMVYKAQQNIRKHDYSNEAMLTDISTFSSQITLWGSREVVQKWVEFRTISLDAGDSQYAQKLLYAMEDVMNAMRKDLGVRKTSKGSLLSFFVNDLPNIAKKTKKQK